MRVIYKHLLPLRDTVTVRMHTGAEVLAVDMQNGSLCAWTIEDTEAGREDRSFFIVGTGAEVPAVAQRHIGTVVDSFHGPGPGGSGFVWHCFMSD